ncbi:hypothetical protein Ciccas_003355 [Cichlidogyrus casuarinus]|uniref:SNF2 N-terminal domain-containing protein n=1 Tax=Cichlidogyrus casuarinus TaxID=1844966 RepID=A0ABD2QEL0_9PLAT
MDSQLDLVRRVNECQSCAATTASLITGPTCSISFLPTGSMSRCLSWMQSSYHKQLPSLLISPGPSNGDMETLLLIHLGQLAAFNREPLDCGHPSTWGPHLIVTSKINLLNWKLRLANICPGLSVVVLNSDSALDRVSGLGQRLRRKAQANQMHVCVTNYALVKHKPSRLATVKWSTISFDSAEFLWPNPDLDDCRSVNSDYRNSPSPSSQCSSVSSKSISEEVGPNVSSTDDWLQVFGKICCENQRILLSRKELPRVGSSQILRFMFGTYESNLDQFVQATKGSTSMQAYCKDFTFHLNGDEDWDSLVKEHRINAPLVDPTQTRLHDEFLSSNWSCLECTKDWCPVGRIGMCGIHVGRLLSPLAD